MVKHTLRVLVEKCTSYGQLTAQETIAAHGDAGLRCRGHYIHKPLQALADAAVDVAPAEHLGRGREYRDLLHTRSLSGLEALPRRGAGVCKTPDLPRLC